MYKEIYIWYKSMTSDFVISHWFTLIFDYPRLISLIALTAAFPFVWFYMTYHAII